MVSKYIAEALFGNKWQFCSLVLLAWYIAVHQIQINQILVTFLNMYLFMKYYIYIYASERKMARQSLASYLQNTQVGKIACDHLTLIFRFLILWQLLPLSMISCDFTTFSQELVYSTCSQYECWISLMMLLQNSRGQIRCYFYNMFDVHEIHQEIILFIFLPARF